MKKIILILAMMSGVLMAKASEPILQESTLCNPPHIEFKYYGIYGVVGYDCVPSLWVDGAYPLPVMQGATGIIGFQFRLPAAVGIGISYWSDPNGLFSQMPLFVEFRTNYLRSRLTPYTTLQVGYTFAMGGRMQQNTDSWYMEKGGVTFGFTVGGRYAIKQHFGISLGVGYQLLHSNSVVYCDDNMMPATKESALLHNLRINFALNF